jgi:hypothetical protein
MPNVFTQKEETILKKIPAVVSTWVIGLAAATVFAQTGMPQHQQPGGMAGPPKGDGQMMSQEMMHEMSGMMGQLQNLMQRMSMTMDQKQDMEHSKRQDIMRTMDGMIITMKEMFQQIGKGKIDPDMRIKTQARITYMNKVMDGLQKGNK